MKLMGSMALTAALLAAPCTAQTYPARPIRMFVPFAPGGGVDFTARLVGQKIAAAFNQSVVSDNRAGAGGVIGTEIAAKAPPDGYTLVLGSACPTTSPNGGA